jgi:hypothetical protein
VPAGIRRTWEKAQDPRLSEREKEYVRGQQEAIWAYYSEHRT